MPGPRRLVLVPVGCLLLLAGALPSAEGAQRAQGALPEHVTIHDTRTSDPVVDIAEVRIEASWYWDSVQLVRVKVPHGFRPGHHLTVYFDLDGDSTPDGHYDLRLRTPKNPGGHTMQLSQEFRLGGGWDDAGTRVGCTGDEGFPPASEVKVRTRSVYLGFDLWSCLQVPKPVGTSSGSWRVAVRVAKGKSADMAPNGRRWSKPVAGWGPCDPAGGSC
jgi:hypothetical protein